MPATESPDAPYRIVTDPIWGYRRIDPLPSASTLDRFYESRYRDLLDDGGRAPDLARLVGGGPDAEAEREWQVATLHGDILDALARIDGAPNGRVLDVGCGTGELLRTLGPAGWDAMGTEPAAGIAEVGRAAGLRIEMATATDYLARWHADDGVPFAAILMLNVLEHLPDPAGLLTVVLGALAPGGRLVVRVPNDFSPLQLDARRALGGPPWWVVVPDHLNYFDHASIGQLLEQVGLQIVDRSADFPMELFLLQGHDYRNDPIVGREVHRRRRQAELAMDPVTRRAIGRAWASAGIGRNAFVVASKPR